jgi:hypothetical protein
MLRLIVSKGPHSLWLRGTAILWLAACCTACHDEPSRTKERDVTVLDGMQLSAARRVGLESAVDAMDRGDLERLKMLKIWVQKRAQVVLFAPADVQALDLAISCLDGSLPRAEREAALDKVESGKLIKSAREVCLEEEE